MAEPSATQRNPGTYELGNLSLQNHNVETLSGDKTLTDSSDMVQTLDPGGAGRNVDLPADDVGLPVYIIANTADAAEDLTVRDSGTNTIHAVSQDEAAMFLNTGSGYVVIGGAAASGGQNV